MPAHSSIRVQIFGKVHQLRADDDPEHMRKVAELVDAKMGQIADHGGTADSYSVAVLAALELADELLRLREERQGAVADESDRIAALLERVEDVTGESSLSAAAD